jgi:hypothetical protein
MNETPSALVLDLVEWLAPRPRPYAEVMDAWRTSCPRLTVWEDAVDAGYVSREWHEGRGALVAITLLAAVAVLIAGCAAPRANVPAVESVPAEIEAKKQRELVMAIQNPNAIAHRGTHPTTPERFVALEKSVEEIAGKRISNQRLMPEMKSHAAPAAPDSETGAGSR